MVDSTVRGDEVPPPPWRTRSRRAARQPLSQEAIVAAALRVLAAEGLDAVSMRRVATELGTGPASLYAHVSGKDELNELMLDEVIGEIPLPEIDPDHWRDAVRAIARESRLAFQRHRDIARVAMVGAPLGPNGLRITERYLAVLRTAGIPDQVCAWAVDRLSLYITADVIEGTMYAARGWRTEQDGAEYWRQVSDYLRGLPADTFPNIVATVDEMMHGDSDERFERGVDMILDGIARYLPEG